MRHFAAALLVALSSTAFAAGDDLGPSSPATLHWQVQDFPVLKRVSPAWPEGAVSSAPVSCRATVRIDGAGLPADVAVEGCPEAFVASTREAVGAWRWAPAGSVTERRVTMNIRYDAPPVRAAAVAPAPVAPVVAPAPVAPVQVAQAPSRPVIPAAPAAAVPGKASVNLVPTSASASRTGEGDGQAKVVCSGAIHRNRIGHAQRIEMGACPPELYDATREVLKILSKTDARKAPRDTPRKRVQPVQIAYTIGEV